MHYSGVLSIILLEDHGKILTFDFLFAFYSFLIAMFKEIILPNNVVMHTLINIFHFHSCQFNETGSGTHELFLINEVLFKILNKSSLFSFTRVFVILIFNLHIQLHVIYL